MPVFNVPYHTKMLGEECDAFLGLADFHQYHPSKQAIQEADLVLMVGCRLDNQMNFGNPPFIPEKTKLVCVNGSHEELEYNLGADLQLLSDPGAFLDALAGLDVRFVHQTGDEGIVEFVATFHGTQGPGRLHERSEFVREEGRWFYVRGELR